MHHTFMWGGGANLGMACAVDSGDGGSQRRRVTATALKEAGVEVVEKATDVERRQCRHRECGTCRR
jgi:hypothetical protein